MVEKANDMQVGGSHYKGQSLSGQEHWDVSWDFNLDGFQHTVSKYLFRWKQKNGLQDLKKAQHTLNKYVELVEKFGPMAARYATKDPAFEKWLEDNRDRLRQLMWGEGDNGKRGGDITVEACGLCGATNGEHMNNCERMPKPALLFKDGRLMPVDPITMEPWTRPIPPEMLARMAPEDRAALPHGAAPANASATAAPVAGSGSPGPGSATASASAPA